MGKISNYARALVAKLQDVFVVDQTDNNVTATKSVTVEQIGDAICGEQVHATLKTDDQTIIGGVNEVNDKADTNATNIGSLSTLTTTDKSSLVGAVNSFLPKVVYSEKNWANSHSFDTANDTAFMLYTDSDTSVAKVRIFNNNTASLYNISGSSITGVTYANGTLTVAVNNRGLVAVRII